MKALMLAALLTLATSASALNLSTPVLDVKATTEACPFIVNNSFVHWFKRMFYPNPFIVNN